MATKTRVFHPLRYLLLVAALAGLAGAVWLLPQFLSPVRPQPVGRPAVVTLTAAQLSGLTEETAAALARQAAACGANALLAPALTASGPLYPGSRLPGAADADPLALLCEAAAKQDLAIYFELSLADASAYSDPAADGYARFWQREVKNLARRYPVAGILLEGCTDPATLSACGKTLAAAGAGLGVSLGDDDPIPSGENVGFFCAPPARAAALLADPALGQGAVFADLRAGSGAMHEFSTLAAGAGFDGALLGALPDGTESRVLTQAAVSLLEQGPLTAADLPLRRTLAVGWPASDGKTDAEGALLLGTSDPDAPLTLNGEPVARAAGGSFAVFCPLAMGENLLVVQNGAVSVTRTLTRTPPVQTQDKPPVPNTQPDTTLAGRFVRVTDPIASALSDPGDASAIQATLRRGAVVPITGTVETVRGGQLVQAYLLSNGDALPASSAELLEETFAASALSLPTVTAPADRVLAFHFADGCPAVYGTESADSLTLRFLGTRLAEGTADLFAAQSAIASARTLADGGDTLLTLTFAPEFSLWGWDVGYEEAGLVLRLKQAPQLAEGAAPLAGVTVLLDPGHGGTDTGAAGIQGLCGGFAEKDVNLALAEVLRQRLSQLGAQVTMTRTDDSFPTLADRYRQAAGELPDFYLAIHHNSTALLADTNTTAGLECYYHGEENAAFAESLLTQLSAVTAQPIRQSAENSYFYVCRQSGIRAVLLEAGYLVNPQEAESCAGAQRQRLFAEGTVRGLLFYLAQPAG